MALIDVTQLLYDPDLIDIFSVISSTAVVNSAGVMVITQGSPVPARGVVIPGRSNMRRLDDGTRVEAYIDIYTTYRLNGGTKADDANSAPADIVIWQSRKYTVAAVEHWEDFGAGFVHASCDLLPLNPAT